MKMCQDVDTRVGTPQMYCTKRNYTGMPDNAHTRSGVQIKLVSIKLVFKKFHVKILFWPIVFGPTNFICPKMFGFKKCLKSKKITTRLRQVGPAPSPHPLSVPVSLCPNVNVSRCPNVLLSQCPVVPLSWCPIVLVSHCTGAHCPSVLVSQCP